MAKRELEHTEQVTLFKWANISAKNRPELALMFAIPNGGDRHPAVAAKLKAEGVKKGVPDICLPVSRNGFNSLWIELKRPIVKGQSKPEVKPEQKWWIDELTKQGSKALVCFGWDSARIEIEDYLRGNHG